MTNWHEILKQVDTQYKREIEILPQRESKLYISLAIFMILIFLGLGVIPNWKNFRQRQVYYAELQNYKKILATRLEEVKSLELQVLAAGEHVDNFNKVMPPSPNIDDYLVELVTTVSQSNFIVESLTTSSQFESNEVAVSVRLTGPNDPTALITLIHNIESMKRISSIEDIRMGLEDGELEVAALLNIYTQEDFELKDSQLVTDDGSVIVENSEEFTQQ